MRTPYFWLWLLAFVACSSAHNVRPGGDAGPDSGSDAGDSGVGHSLCAHATDCQLVPRSCCGSCGAYTRDDIVSLHRNDVAAHREQACGPMAVCPKCLQERDPALVAFCGEEGSCDYLDLRNPEDELGLHFTSCEQDSECVVRARQCCECGAPIGRNTLVAIRVDTRAEFEELVCPPGIACPECAPDYDPFFSHCGSDAEGLPKHCRLDFVGP